MPKSIIGLLLGIAALAILLTGCSDEPDSIPSNGTGSITTTSLEQGVNPEPTHAPTSAVTNIAVSKVATPSETPTATAREAVTPTPTGLPAATAKPADRVTAAAETSSAREFASVSAGGDHTCGVKREGSIECWGDDDYGLLGNNSGRTAGG